MDQNVSSQDVSSAQAAEINEMPHITWSKSALVVVLLAAIAYAQIERRIDHSSLPAQYIVSKV